MVFISAAAETFAIALEDAHVSRWNFFEDVLTENLDSIAFKHFNHKYVVDSLKLLTRAEITKIKEIAERGMGASIIFGFVKLDKRKL